MLHWFYVPTVRSKMYRKSSCKSHGDALGQLKVQIQTCSCESSFMGLFSLVG